MRLPRPLAIIFIIICVIGIGKSMMSSKDEATMFDLPKTLNEEKLTITAHYYGNTNGAQIFTIVKNGGEEDRLYLEPANSALTIPANFMQLKDSGYVLKLYGAYFKGKGIPERFFNIQPKPEKYAVFRFESLEMVKE